MQKFGLRRCMRVTLSSRASAAWFIVLLSCGRGRGHLCSSSARPLRCVHGWLCSKEIDVSRLESCGPCTGSGIKSGTSASTCGTCGGSGQVVQAVRTPLGVFQQVRCCGIPPVPQIICSTAQASRGALLRLSRKVPPEEDVGSSCPACTTQGCGGALLCQAPGKSHTVPAI